MVGSCQRQLKHVYRVLVKSWLHGSNMYRPKTTETRTEYSWTVLVTWQQHVQAKGNWNTCTEYSWTVLVTWQQHVQVRQLKHMYRVLVNNPGYMAATCTGQTTEMHVQSTRELSWLHGSNMYCPEKWKTCTEYSWTVLVTWQQHVQAKQLKHMYRVLVNSPGYMAATCTGQKTETHVQSTCEQSWLHVQVRQLKHMHRVLMNCPGYMAATCTVQRSERHVQSTREQSWLHGSNIYRSDKWNTCTEYMWTVLVTCTGQTTETHAQSTHNSPCYRVASSTGQKQLKHTYTHCSHMQSWYHVVPHTLHAYRQTGGACSALREFFQCLLHFNLGKTKVLHSAFVWLTSKAHVESYGTDRAREVWHVDANLQPLHTSTMEWSVNLDDSLHIA